MTMIPSGFALPTTRRCDKCGIEKPMNAFYTRPDRPLFAFSHWFATCRTCIVEAKRTKYRADPAKAAATRKRQWANKREREAVRASWGAFQRKAVAEREQDQRDRKLRTVESRAILKAIMPRKGRQSMRQQAAQASLKRGAADALRKQESAPGGAVTTLDPRTAHDLDSTATERAADTERRLKELQDPHRQRMRQLQTQTAPRPPLPFGGSQDA
jgi:hypothetical protein